jgi:hypothetical protein
MVWSRAVLIVVLLASATLVAVGLAPPAQAAGCSGSGCDNPPRSVCNGDSRVPSPQSSYAKYATKTTITSSGHAYTAEMGVALWYSPSCRSVWAEIIVSPAPPSGSTCYVKIQRNSDGRVLRAGVSSNGATARGDTNMLNDRNVMSFAWGYCAWAGGGPVITLGTSSW